MKPPRHLFLVGLHRSGTTLLARLLADHPAISGFSDTGVMMDEGQHLQTVFQPYDEPAWFSFHPKAHHTERSPLATPQNADRLRREWYPHWDLGKPVLLEKSPGNLFRTRILQAFFPDPAFIFVHRHPVAQAFAMEKWNNPQPPALSLWNWTRSYRLARDDAQYLRRAIWISYEALARRPEATMRRLYDFLGIDPVEPGDRVRPHVNDRYFSDWERFRRGSPRQRLQAGAVRAALGRGIARWGYSFERPYTLLAPCAGS